MITITITIDDEFVYAHEFAAALLADIDSRIDDRDYPGIPVTIAATIDGRPYDIDDDVHYLCDVCGRIGTVDDGISASGDDCPDETCGGTVRTYRGDAS